MARAHRLRLALAAFLALALIPAACGSSRSSSDPQHAKELLQRALRAKVRSSDVSFAARADLRGVALLAGRPLRLRLAGPLRSNGARSLPSLDWRIRVEGAGQSFDARAILVPHNAYLEYDGTTYAVGESAVRKLERQLRRRPKRDLSLARLGIDPSRWIEDARVADGGLVAGAPTRKVSGKVDVGALLRDFDKLLESPQVRAELPPGMPAPRISKDRIDQLQKVVEDPRFEAYVGRQDGVLRRLRASLDFKLSDQQRRSAAGLEGGHVTLAFEQTHINGHQRIAAPSGAQPLSELLRRLGISPDVFGLGSTSSL